VAASRLTAVSNFRRRREGCKTSKESAAGGHWLMKQCRFDDRLCARALAEQLPGVIDQGNDFRCHIEFGAIATIVGRKLFLSRLLPSYVRVRGMRWQQGKPTTIWDASPIDWKGVRFYTSVKSQRRFTVKISASLMHMFETPLQVTTQHGLLRT